MAGITIMAGLTVTTTITAGLTTIINYEDMNVVRM
jgi:hypothetical protein